MSKRKSAYGAPQEEKEVVITIDRRLALVAGLVVVFGLALGAGVWWAGQAGDAAVASATGAGGDAPVNLAAAPPALSEEQIRAEMREANLPESAVIITPNVPVAPDDNPFFEVQVTPAVAADQAPPSVMQPGGHDAVAMPETSANPLEGAGEDVTQLLPPETNRPGGAWDHDVLAGMPDPNLAAEDAAGRGVKPVIMEKATEPLEGPRIAISELNDQHTYDFGVVPMSEVAEHEFLAKNVGNEDLVITRIYAGCGCTATVFGDTQIKADGFLPSPVTLKPGESRPFTVQFDPQAEGKRITQAKYIQIYSNDPTRYLFDDNEPLSHEVRFRIVVQPQ